MFELGDVGRGFIEFAARTDAEEVELLGADAGDRFLKIGGDGGDGGGLGSGGGGEFHVGDGFVPIGEVSVEVAPIVGAVDVVEVGFDDVAVLDDLDDFFAEVFVEVSGDFGTCAAVAGDFSDGGAESDEVGGGGLLLLLPIIISRVHAPEGGVGLGASALSEKVCGSGVFAAADALFKAFGKEELPKREAGVGGVGGPELSAFRAWRCAIAEAVVIVENGHGVGIACGGAFIVLGVALLGGGVVLFILAGLSGALSIGDGILHFVGRGGFGVGGFFGDGGDLGFPFCRGIGEKDDFADGGFNEEGAHLGIEGAVVVFGESGGVSAEVGVEFGGAGGLFIFDAVVEGFEEGGGKESVAGEFVGFLVFRASGDDDAGGVGHEVAVVSGGFLLSGAGLDGETREATIEAEDNVAGGFIGLNFLGEVAHRDEGLAVGFGGFLIGGGEAVVGDEVAFGGGEAVNGEFMFESVAGVEDEEGVIGPESVEDGGEGEFDACFGGEVAGETNDVGEAVVIFERVGDGGGVVFRGAEGRKDEAVELGGVDVFVVDADAEGVGVGRAERGAVIGGGGGGEFCGEEQDGEERGEEAAMRESFLAMCGHGAIVPPVGGEGRRS